MSSLPLTSDDTESKFNQFRKDHSCQIWAKSEHFENLTQG